MKYAAAMLALLTVTSAAMASDRNYVAPKNSPSAQVSARTSNEQAATDNGFADHRVVFVKAGK